MVQRVVATKEEFDRLALAESERVFTALEAAFSQEGVEYDLVRYIGLVNGCVEFLSVVTKDLYDLSHEEHRQLEIDAITLFAKHTDCIGIEIHEE